MSKKKRAGSRLSDPLSDYTFNDVMVLAATIYGEARGEDQIGKEAVAHTIKNRVRKGGWYGKDIKTVCTKPFQYSCWNAGDPNYGMVADIAFNWAVKNEMILNNHVIQSCLEAALAVLLANSEDVTIGSLHYHNDKIMTPDWAQGKEPVVVIGHHKFYNNID